MKGLVVDPGNHSQQGNIFLTKHKLDFTLGHILQIIYEVKFIC